MHTRVHARKVDKRREYIRRGRNVKVRKERDQHVGRW